MLFLYPALYGLLTFFLLMHCGCKILPPKQGSTLPLETFCPGTISTSDYSENTFSFTKDQRTLFVSRTTGWTIQQGLLATEQAGDFSTLTGPPLLDSIYNGAINPEGNKIIFCVRKGSKESIYLTKKTANNWSKPINLSQTSNLEGGYFYWFSDTELYLYVSNQNGNIVQAQLLDDQLQIANKMAHINTDEATEFSIYMHPRKKFLIFSRYQDNNPAQQGLFISFNLGQPQAPNWSIPQKIDALPYGWNPYIHPSKKLFLFSDGEDILSLPMRQFNPLIQRLKKTAVSADQH